MNTKDGSELLREPDVTREFKLTGPWLRKTRRLKTGPPYVRLGRMIFYVRRDIEDFVAAHRVEPDGYGAHKAKECNGDERGREHGGRP